MKFSRKEIWQHNGFLGTCAFARKGMQSVLSSRTATAAAKDQALVIINAVYHLETLLKEKAS
jgi:hypothetical protein